MPDYTMTRTTLTTQLFAAALVLVIVGPLPAAAQTFDAAVEAYERGDYATALAGLWDRLAAELGLAAAQHNLGVMYDRGEGVPKDNAEAVRWYRLAAEQGADRAQFTDSARMLAIFFWKWSRNTFTNCSNATRANCRPSLGTTNLASLFTIITCGRTRLGSLKRSAAYCSENQ